MMEQLADYTIRQTMRESNHGLIFLAEPPERLGITDEVVALKALRGHSDADDFRRMANELRLLHSVDSDYIIELLDAGNAGGRLFFATRYYPDGSLEDAYGRLSEPTIRRAVSDAARGVHALHQVGVAHRNIQPANVLLRDGRGLIAELDLAQLINGRSATVGGGPLGSLEFTCPDIIWGHDASRHTDTWSLGMTLHRSLTGTGALGIIPATGLLDACRYVLGTRPMINDQVDSVTRRILDRCFSEDPSDHYPTAEAFADDLDSTLAEVSS